jgi:hypothetical protein
MPQSVHASGTQNTTPGSDNPLDTWTAPTGGAIYALTLDVSALLNGEVLYAYGERAAVAGGTRRQLWRVPVAAHALGGIVETTVIRAPAGVQVRVGIRQVGGSTRGIPWAIERLDG